MSEDSYQRNVARGLTGPETATCYPAAFDRISFRNGVRPETYEAYNQLWHKAQQKREAKNYVRAEIVDEARQLYQKFMSELGASAMSPIQYERVYGSS